MKRTLSFLLALAMMLSFSMTTIASGGAQITDEYLASIADEIARDKALRAHRVMPFALGDPGWDTGLEIKEIIPLKQDTDYYCGPACMRMAYQLITRKFAPSQLWYAEKMAKLPDAPPITEGVLPDQIKTIWNNYHGDLPPYGLGYITSMSEKATFETDVQWGIYDKRPVFALVRTLPLDAYDYSIYHWILVAGYQYDRYGSGAHGMVYYDPINIAPGHAKRWDRANNITQALLANNGMYLVS